MAAPSPARPHGTRADHLAHTLTQHIATGQLHPGARLHYEELEATYAVSRTVVREALRILEGRGLVEARPHVGTRVTERARWNVFDTALLGAMTQHDPQMREGASQLQGAVSAYRDLAGANILTNYLCDTLGAALAS